MHNLDLEFSLTSRIFGSEYLSKNGVKCLCVFQFRCQVSSEFDKTRKSTVYTPKNSQFILALYADRDFLTFLNQYNFVFSLYDILFMRLVKLWMFPDFMFNLFTKTSTRYYNSLSLIRSFMKEVNTF